MKILFVCLGNICRSPAAEEIMRQKAFKKGLDIEVDSCGTGNWHVGSHADSRMIEVCKARGYNLTGTARQITEIDFKIFDYVLVADRSLMEELSPHKVYFITEHTTKKDVPDPYYGEDGFANVVTTLEKACDAWLNFLTLK